MSILHNKITRFKFVKINIKFNSFYGKTVMGIWRVCLYLRRGRKRKTGDDSLEIEDRIKETIKQ